MYEQFGFISDAYYPAGAAGPLEIAGGITSTDLIKASEYPGLPAEDIEAALLQDLLTAFQSAKLMEPIPNPIMAQARRKWHLVSAIQKSIRRSDAGSAIVLSIAMQNSTEADALWRRLQVTALEDIGIANPVLVATVLAVAGKKAWREKNGGKALTAFIVDRMAKSAKSRMFCHLMCYLSASPRFAEAHTHWADLDLTEQDQFEHLTAWLGAYDLDAIPDAEGEELDGRVALAALASKALAGHLNYLLPGEDPKARDAKRRYSTGSAPIHEAALDKMPSQLTPLWRYIMKRARGSGLEGLMHAIPATVPYLAAKHMTLELRPLPEIEVFTKLPSVAFDKHTIEGKRAIHSFGVKVPSIKGALSKLPEDQRLAALGSAVFYVEGGEPMSPVFESQLGITIQRSEHVAYARRYGTTPEDFDTLHALVLANLGELNNARRTILEK